MIDKMAAPSELSHFLHYFDDIAKPVVNIANQTRIKINEDLQSSEPCVVIVITALTVTSLIWIYHFIFQEESLLSRAYKWIFRILRKLPFIGDMIQKELNKTLASVRKTMADMMKNRQFITQLPTKGVSPNEVLRIADSYAELIQINPQNGRVSGTVYSVKDEYLDNLVSKMYDRHHKSNPLHPDLFTDVRKMEAEVVRMCLTMFHGGSDTCGVVSSGGTESILLACKAYRNLAYDRGIKHPEMIVPQTAHAAFDKAADCFRFKLVRVDVDHVNWAVRPRDIKRLINGNTCMIVASAPNYPHGIVDPVEEIAKLGLQYNVPVHVDSCLGGFLLPFMEKAGFHDIPPFDFRVPGVTSISCDTHKYGYAPKGSSVILYTNRKYRDFQFDVIPDWSGGIYATPTFAGSRCGANATVCWATMMFMGESGYVDKTRTIIETARYLLSQIEKIRHLYIFGEPKVSVIAMGSLDFNIYRLYDAMTARGWHLNALQFPSSFHVCVTLPMTMPGVADSLISDLNDSVEEIMLDPTAKCGGMGALYGMAQSIPDRSMVREICHEFLSAYYDTCPSPSLTNGTSPP